LNMRCVNSLLMVAIIILVSTIHVIIPTGPALAQELTSGEIVDSVNALMNQQTVKALTKMVITTSSGDKREFEFESYARDKGEKSLLKYISPIRVKDQAILMLNNADDIWVYFPRTNRVRKLATHAKKQKMEGSDFSYEDLGSGESWLTDFTSTKLSDEEFEGVDCYRIELRRKEDAGSGYSRMIMWVAKNDFVPRRIDYYSEDDPDVILKRLTLTDIQEIEGIPTPMKMVMLDLQDNTDTVMEYEELTYDVELPDDLFTERGMKK
jgi:outer membrane lipoprotein-sorting protein